MVNVVLDIGVRLTILLTLVSGINVDQRCSGRLVRLTLTTTSAGVVSGVPPEMLNVH